MLNLKSKPKLKISFLILLAILLAGNYYLMGKDIKKKIILKEILEKKEKLLIEQNALLENYFILKAKEEEATRLEEERKKEISATITAFNTVPWQTDNSPCMAKFGYICERDDVVACPRDIPAHTKVIIFNKEYECMDWTAYKYNGRFDISFDKDIQGAKNFGKKYTKVIVKL